MSKHRQAPGPRGSLVMGNLAAYKRNPITMLLRLHQQYGDVARNRLGPFVTHALAHPDHVQYVLQENHRNYVRGRFYDNFKMFFGDGLLTTDGEFWRRHRRAVQPLFHKKQVDGHTAAVGDAALALAHRWSALPPGKSIDVVEEMMHLSLRMLGLMVFNTDVSSHAEAVGPAVRFGIEAMMPQGNMNDFIPRWAPTRFNRRIAHARRAIDTIIAKIIADHRGERCEPSDVISLLLNARDPDTGAPMTQQEVHDEVMTVFLAGHETTGAGLAWALYALAQHPAVLRQLRDELDARLGGRAPAVQDFEQLPYLSQVVDESLRVYPPIWGFTRDLVEDDEIGGYRIPARSSVFMSPYVTHRHPAFWRNPDAFDPENFASDAAARHRFVYFPFGGGMRKCIGFQTALLQMRVLVAVVAQHFDLNVLPGHPIELGATISLRPVHGIRLIVKPRERQQSHLARVREHEAARALRPLGDTVEPTGAACPMAAAGEIGASAAAVAAAESAQALDVAHASGAAVTDERAATRQHADAARLSLATPSATASRDAAADASARGVPAWRFTWQPAPVDPIPDAPSPALSGKRIALVNGRGGTVERIAAALARTCTKVSVFAPAANADYAEATRTFVNEAGPLDGIVDLGLEAPFTLDDASAWEAPMRRTVELLKACYGDWAAEDDTSRLFYVALTWMDGMMGYGDAAAGAQPLGGLWAGLAKTLPQELPNCNVRVLDIAPDETGRVDRLVVNELYRWGLFEVGYRQGVRYTLHARRNELPPLAVDARTALAPGDTVLFSGGARGIGLLCARALAERHGCTVIVTGREAPPDGSEPWMALDDEGFKRYGLEQLRAATPDNPPKAIRATLQRLRRRRELKAALDEMAALDLPVRYRVCDVTDRAAVRALCDELGDSLRMVIHNAGVDQPVRLIQKGADDFARTVRTKVLGFANLCDAVRTRPRLVQFCNVGSLTGRWGGMTGETDYAAANEGLARLGLWAAKHALAPACGVKTLVWPTWEGVGMITNFAVTQRYITPMNVDEGVRHWLRELASPGSGEVMFMGAVGRAPTPVQIKGFQPIRELPNIGELVTRRHHVGEPLRFRPFKRFEGRYAIDPAVAPYAHAFRFNGRAVLPASLVLEHACAVGDWVMPPTGEPRDLSEMTNVVLRLDALPGVSNGGAPAEIGSEAAGYMIGDVWCVDVRCSDTRTQAELLSMTLVYRPEPEQIGAAYARPPGATPEPPRLTSAPHAAWNGDLLPAGDWSVPDDASAGIVRIGRVPPAAVLSLWTLPFPLELRLPVNHVEHVLRVLLAEWGAAQSDAPAVWRIGGAKLARLPASSADGVVEYATGRFAVVDARGYVLLRLDDTRVDAAQATRPEAGALADPLTA
ncbi:cytochrome P450 [Burkholderia mayonis]|uniref:Cytochrome n=1 Tax=Burkholderia mayonis TaxID=1385591 RepID=A0A1B4FWC7_9BURK|nr:cytochrome P450 [Burkholderia mayonis]AOJ07967.1 cytochrome [Burkholderia mayonis]KVE55472.1 cytochrome [Burkholderia mayonis]